ncbi:MAG TPA: Gfo/Idh/MocA family oxidoreductase [Planktothrix sp.]|jgi:predicted dehydrogenase
MSSPFRVAIAGAGFMGEVHALRWQRHTDVELLGVFDCEADSAARLELPVFKSWDEMLAAKPDVIDICTPTTTHVELIEKACQAGLSILVEKPLARTLADCDRCIELVEKYKVNLMVGHVVRYFPEYQAARTAVLDGRIGTPATARMGRLAPFPRAQRKVNWYADTASSGGLILDMIIHDLDWLRWCFGPAVRIFGKGLYEKIGDENRLDYALVTVRFQSGLIAHITGSWAHVSGFRTNFELAGDGGMLEHDSALSAPLSIQLRAKEGTAVSGLALPESPVALLEDPYYLEQRAFLDALKKKEQPPVSAHDAREAVRLALAALKSVETGKVVELV